MKDFVFALGLAFYPVIRAAISKTCPSTDVCYSLNIPDATASSGTGDVFFQISAPTSYSWVALGQGSQMAGANMFIMYTSASGQNVTVSPRLGKGNYEPQTNGDTSQITLLEGSGVANGTMTANVQCSYCSQWTGGRMDFTSSSATWIYAEKSGQSINSDDVNEELAMHNNYGDFNWDFTTAKGGSDSNPFVSQAQNQQNQPAVSDQPTEDDSGDSPKMTHIRIAHGVLASLVWVILFPTGAIVLRVVPRHATWIHASIQATAYVILIVSFGMGVWMATQYQELDTNHAIIGIVVFSLASTQPISGLLHHFRFIKTNHRSVFSVVHLTFGRAAIILGIINGGLGIQLADDASSGQRAAYGVIAGVFGIAFLAAGVYGEIRHASNKKLARVGSSEEVEKK